MSSWCHTTALVTGDEKQARKLYDKLKQILSSKKPKVESDFGTGWLGNILEEHGIDYKTIACRGKIQAICPRTDGFALEAFTNWTEAALMNTLDTLIEKEYDELNVFWYAEEPDRAYYCSNDRELRICPGRYLVRYIVGDKQEIDYVATEKYAFDIISNLTNERPSTINDVLNIQKRLREKDPDAEAIVYAISFIDR